MNIKEILSCGLSLDLPKIFFRGLGLYLGELINYQICQNVRSVVFRLGIHVTLEGLAALRKQGDRYTDDPVVCVTVKVRCLMR